MTTKSKIRPKELYDLHYTFTSFILPRLKSFKKYKGDYPGSLSNGKKWDEKLDSMINAFDLLSKDKIFDTEEQKIIDKGLKNFAKYYQDLWF